MRLPPLMSFAHYEITIDRLSDDMSTAAKDFVPTAFLLNEITSLNGRRRFEALAVLD